MAEGDAPGTVTICKGQGLFLRADDAGVLVRNNYFGRARRIRIAWTEISHFADGGYTKEDVTRWMLVIVPRASKQVPVLCSTLEPADQVMAAVRDASQPHGVPVELTGIPAKKGRPAARGFYRDPGGLTGLRHWNGRQWSPLLPPDVVNSRSTAIRPSPGAWSALPTADGAWTYASRRAALCMAWFAVSAVVSAALLAYGLMTELGRGTRLGHVNSVMCFVLGCLAALYAFTWLGRRKFFLKLDEAASRAPAA